MHDSSGGRKQLDVCEECGVEFDREQAYRGLAALGLFSFLGTALPVVCPKCDAKQDE